MKVIHTLSLNICVLLACDASQKAPPAVTCPSAPVSLSRVLADITLDRCEISTAGYYSPSERSSLYLSSEDHDAFNEPSSVRVGLPLQQDDGGYWIKVNGVRWHDWQPSRLLGVRGTVVWIQDLPTIENGHDLNYWSTPVDQEKPVELRRVKNP
jgi:hypothetical protein